MWQRSGAPDSRAKLDKVRDILAFRLGRYNRLDALYYCASGLQMRNESWTLRHQYKPLKLTIPSVLSPQWDRCALHLAVEQSGLRRDSCHEIQQLLRNGNDIEAADIFGKTPLLRAAEVGNVEAVSELLNNGASCLARTMEGWTALHLAAGNGHVKVVSKVSRFSTPVEPIIQHRHA
eukprot:scaffold228051_cov46-Prasinocladus_malaysianus.AAC.2